VSVLMPAGVWQYYAMNILSGEWLHRDLPLQGVQLTDTLSGPGAISATLDPDVAALKTPSGAPILDEWSTLIIAEADGQIRSAGILANSTLSGPTMSLDCVGFAGYPTGQILEDTLTWSGNASLLAGGHGVDPLTVVRALWASLQGKPDANLGVTVDTTTSNYFLGTFTNVQAAQKSTALPDGSTDPKEVGEDVPIDRAWGPTDKLPTVASGKTLTWSYALNWWDNVDIGSTIDGMVKQVPFDYREDARWSSDAREAITMRLRLGAPRLGTRRSDLRFVEGENISAVVTITRSGDDYGNYVLALGAGEGQTQVRTTASKRDGRLRRMIQLNDGSKTTADSLKASATQQLNLSNKLANIVGFTVRDHPNARIGTWDVGDDVLVQTHVGWQPTSLWVRITAASVSPDTGDVIITCSRSDRFSYSPGGVS
jgi:hypothetical protein